MKPDGKFEGYRIRAVHCLSDGSVLAADTHYRHVVQKLSREIFKKKNTVFTYEQDNSNTCKNWLFMLHYLLVFRYKRISDFVNFQVSCHMVLFNASCN